MSTTRRTHDFHATIEHPDTVQDEYAKARAWGAGWQEESGWWVTPRVGVRGRLDVTFVEVDDA